MTPEDEADRALSPEDEADRALAGGEDYAGVAGHPEGTMGQADPLTAAAMSNPGVATALGAGKGAFGVGVADEMQGVAQAAHEFELRHPVLGGIGRVVGSIAYPPLGLAMLGRDLGEQAANYANAPEGGNADDRPSSEPSDWKALVNAYTQGRDMQRGVQHVAEEFQPEAFGGAQTALSLAAPLPPVAKALSPLAKLGQAMKAGATLGGLSAFGNSEAPTLWGQAKDAAVGTALGAGGGAVLGTAGLKAAPRVAGPLSDLAESQTLKAVSSPGLTDRLVKKGITTEEGRHAFARKLLDEGVIAPFETAEGLYARNTNARRSVGAQLGAAYAPIENTPADFVRNADFAKQAIGNEYSRIGQTASAPALEALDAHAGTGAVSAARGALDAAAAKAAAASKVSPQAKLLAALEAQGKGSSKRANTLRNAMSSTEKAATEREKNALAAALRRNTVDSRIPDTRPATHGELRRAITEMGETSARGGNTPPIAKQIERTARSAMRTDQLAQAEQHLGPDKVDEIKSLNARYNTLSNADEVLQNAASREAQKSGHSLKDVATAAGLAAGVGVTSHSLPAAAAAATLPPVIGAVRRRLPSTVAMGAEGLRSAVRTTPVAARVGGVVAGQQSANKQNDPKHDEEAIGAFLRGM